MTILFTVFPLKLLILSWKIFICIFSDMWNIFFSYFEVVILIVSLFFINMLTFQ